MAQDWSAEKTCNHSLTHTLYPPSVTNMAAEHGPLRRISERVRNQILHVLIPLVVEEMVDVARQTVEEVPGRIVEPAKKRQGRGRG